LETRSFFGMLRAASIVALREREGGRAREM